ncbi:hypothetical protein V6C03_14145 [Methyloligella sp. 2.7D]|uniref:hypothetical protein n=1 Tax=unclassified Methyloligella TaxID=2625955 RepID=UPI00157BFF9A|nr:hypothetical protein [Methyloligella sp. GL2]QKP77103.1 hypothetical protein HT051_06320 [Methyloligella sp. GL2]
MRNRAMAAATLAVLLAATGFGGAARAAALCTDGDAETKIACLSDKVAGLEAKLAEVEKQLAGKAEAMDPDIPGQRPDDDIVRFNSPVALRNQDMRIFPRCLDNPGPDSPNLTAVMATSCAPAAGQTWHITRPSH